MKLGKILFGFGKRHRYFLIPLFAFLAFVVAPYMGFGAIEGGFMATGATAVTFTEGEVKLMKTIKDDNKSMLTKEFADFKIEIDKLVNEKREGVLTQEDFDKSVNDWEAKLKKSNEDMFAAYDKRQTELSEALKIQGEKMQEILDKKIKGTDMKSLKDAIAEFCESDDFKNASSKGFGMGYSAKMEIDRKTVSITSDYGATRALITTGVDRVLDHPQVVRLNIRDLIPNSPIDTHQLAFLEVYSWDRNADVLAENGTLADTTFKMQESTVVAKRIGHAVPISKNVMKSVPFISTHLSQRLPAMVRYVEDFQLLFGDGAGNNVQGLFDVVEDFATRINTQTTGAAASVSSVATYDGGAKAKITFAANQVIDNGSKITIANATEATYNGTHDVTVIDPKHILIDLTYVAEADTSAWTFTVANRWKTNVAAAQEADVLRVALSLVTVGEYSANGIVLNPQDAAAIELLKGNDEHYIGVKRSDNGILMIGGVPVVETTAMPAGKFMVGDWALGCGVYWFEDLTLEFAEDVDTKKKNEIVAIVQEQLLFPIFNQYMFISGSFTTAINAINEV